MYPSNNKLKSGAGFTMMEMLIVIAVLGILGTMAFTGYQASRRHAALDSQADVLVGMIRDTQRLSIAAEKGASWKLQCAGDTVSQYAVPSAVPERTVTMSELVVCTGSTDVAFAKLTGAPMATATFVVTMPDVGTKTITVTEAGSVEEAGS